MKYRRCRYAGRHISTSWGRLPLTALVQVMHYLTDSEKVTAGQVCRHWKIAYDCPMLWRDHEFEFGGSRFRPLGQRAVLFAQKFGKHLRHVRIICRQLTSHTCETMLGNLQTFLESLVVNGPPALQSIEFEGLELEFWRYGYLRDQVAHTLVKFFQSQHKLKTLRMRNAQFAMKPGIDVLETIADKNGDKLENLIIEFFFQSRLAVYPNAQFRNVMQKFLNLQTVHLNYSYLSEDLVRAWAQSLRGTLEEIFIKCQDAEHNGHVISNSAWTSLARACPCLSVDVAIWGVGPSSTIIPMLAKTMPLRRFKIFTGYDNGSELGTKDTLGHLINFHQHLQQLDLEFDNYHDDIDDALMTLVTRCRQLTHLRVKAQTEVQVARYICRLLEEGRTSLVHIDLMLCDISPLEVEDLNELREDMSYIAGIDGVDLILRDDLYPDAYWGEAHVDPLPVLEEI